MGMFAGLLTFVLVIVGCDHNPRPWSGDEALFGEWIAETEDENSKLPDYFNFDDKGKVMAGDDEMYYTASDNKIQLYVGSEKYTGTYSIIDIEDDNEELTLTIDGAGTKKYTHTGPST
jgi:hypothetical protein